MNFIVIEGKILPKVTRACGSINSQKAYQQSVRKKSLLFRFGHSWPQLNHVRLEHDCNTIAFPQSSSLHTVNARSYVISLAHGFSCWHIPLWRCDTVPVKGTAAIHARKARVLHAHYTQSPRSVHAVSTHLTHKCTKMRVITRMLLHAVDMILRVKLHAVVQLELINCV